MDDEASQKGVAYLVLIVSLFASASIAGLVAVYFFLRLFVGGTID